jgi:hypothetical protein
MAEQRKACLVMNLKHILTTCENDLLQLYWITEDSGKDA